MHRIRPWLYIGKVRETGDRSIMYTYKLIAYAIGLLTQMVFLIRRATVR